MFIYIPEAWGQEKGWKHRTEDYVYELAYYFTSGHLLARFGFDILCS